MDDVLISVWGPPMRKALLLYFRDYGVPNPDPGRPRMSDRDRRDADRP